VPAGIWLAPPALCPVTSYWPGGTWGPGHPCVCPGVHVVCAHENEKLCDQFAASTVGPVKVDGHPVETGAALDHTNVPDALAMSTTGHAYPVASTVHAGPLLSSASDIATGCPGAYELWSVPTLAAKLVQTHAGGKGSVVVVVVVGAATAWGAGANVLAFVCTAGVVVVVVEVEGGVVAGEVLTRAAAA
jgi:hypothetical protein